MLAPAGDMVGPGSPFTEVKAAIRSDRWLVLWRDGPRLEVARLLGSLPRWHHHRRNPLAGCSYRAGSRSEEHTSELQSLRHLVCRLLLEKKKQNTTTALRPRSPCRCQRGLRWRVCT